MVDDTPVFRFNSVACRVLLSRLITVGRFEHSLWFKQEPVARRISNGITLSKTSRRNESEIRSKYRVHWNRLLVHNTTQHPPYVQSGPPGWRVLLSVSAITRPSANVR